MKHLQAALLVVLAFSALSSGSVDGQGGGTPPPVGQRMAGSLKQNDPNPFNPDTTIPFTIGLEGNPPVCTDPNRRHRVTLKIHDLLSKVAGIPIMKGGGDLGGSPVNGLILGCGSYEAFWDGTLLTNGRKVSSGTYLYILEVDGQMAVKRMFVGK
jgi:hypothetical protein